MFKLPVFFNNKALSCALDWIIWNYHMNKLLTLVYNMFNLRVFFNNKALSCALDWITWNYHMNKLFTLVYNKFNLRVFFNHKAPLTGLPEIIKLISYQL